MDWRSQRAKRDVNNQKRRHPGRRAARMNRLALAQMFLQRLSDDLIKLFL